MPPAVEAFRALTGRAPDGVWAAPGRVNLIGEHTDYNDGFVLPFAIDRHATVAVGRRGDGVVRVRSVQTADQWTGRLGDVGPGRAVGWPSYVVGVAWALRLAGADVPGFDLVVDSSVPIGAGLSSSAALEAATAVALDDLLGLALDRTTLATACRRAENDIAGAATGVMDQMTALHARSGHAMLLDCRSLTVDHVPFDPGAEGLAVLVVDTAVRHDNAHGGYADRRRACEAAARALGVTALRDATVAQVEALDDPLRRRARHVVEENRRVMDVVACLRTAGVRSIGALLDESHASMRDDFEISCNEIEVAVDALRRAGAAGARLTGAGFGGCAIALVDADDAPAVAEAVGAAFRSRGLAVSRAFSVVPSAAAGRVR